MEGNQIYIINPTIFKICMDARKLMILLDNSGIYESYRDLSISCGANDQGGDLFEKILDNLMLDSILLTPSNKALIHFLLEEHNLFDQLDEGRTKLDDTDMPLVFKYKSILDKYGVKYSENANSVYDKLTSILQKNDSE